MHGIKRTLWGRILAVFVMAVFVFNISVGAVLAQEQQEDSENAVPEEVQKDSEVTPEDLGIIDQQILPGDFFYPLKEAWRGVRYALTFSDAAAARLDLQFASEKLVEAQKLVERDGGDSPRAARAVAHFEARLGRLQERLEKVAASGDAEKVEDLQRRIARAHLRQALLLDKLEEKVAEKTLAAVQKAREKGAQTMADALLRSGGDSDRAKEILSEAVADWEGNSNFRGLKALEVLKAVEERAPDQAKAAIRGAQENILRHFEEKLSEMPEEVRMEKMTDYVRHMPGDETLRLKVLEEMRLRSRLPAEVRTQIEELQNEAVERFDEKFDKLKSDEARKKFLQRTADAELRKEMERRRQMIEREREENLRQNREEQPQSKTPDSLRPAGYSRDAVDLQQASGSTRKPVSPIQTSPIRDQNIEEMRRLQEEKARRVPRPDSRIPSEPVSFDPVGALGQVLGIFLRN